MSEPRIAEDYRPGYFLARLVRGGPLMPARIWRPCVCTVNGEETHDWRETCDRYPPLVAEIDGKPAGLDWVWNSRDVITEAEFRYRMDAAVWDRDNDADAPAANPDKPVDLRNMTPVW